MKRFEDEDFTWDGVWVDYEMSECTCGEQYCGCRRIVSTSVRSVDVFKIVGKAGLSGFDAFVADRILRVHHAFDRKNWYVKTCSGYYGEEIEGAYLSNGREIDTDVSRILDLPDLSSRVEAMLVLEYSYLLEACRGLDWRVAEVRRDAVIFGQRDHYKQLDRDAVKSYADYPFPRGIAVEEGERFRLIDGYHRTAAATAEMVQMIVGRPKVQAPEKPATSPPSFEPSRSPVSPAAAPPLR
jgi:hypothetical protein